MRRSLGRRLIPAVLGVMEARSVPMLAGGAGLAVARTAAVNLFVVVELFYLFSCRSLTHSM